MEDQEVSLFVGNVFKMFDQNNDHRLDFFEFTLATSTKFSMVDEDPREKLEWLFENVYDKVKNEEKKCMFPTFFFALVCT